jgi:FMN phosphatase YigB (HAD superfamily)
MTNRKINTIAFDMVGVLIQTEKLVSVRLKEFLGERLLIPIDDLKERYDTGYCIGTMDREAFWDGVIAEPWHGVERAFLEQLPFASGADETFKSLTDVGLRVAVISDMPREWAEIVLRYHRVLPYITASAYSNDGHGSKKDGRLFSALIASADTNPGSILLVDDRAKNVTQARELGMQARQLPLPDSDEKMADTLTSVQAVLAIVH